MFPVFPVGIIDGRKVPLITGWKEKATTDDTQIKQWQSEFRDRLKYWGVPTGVQTGIFVVDADVKHGGLDTLQDSSLFFPETCTQTTMSGGKHLIYRYPTDGRTYGQRVGFRKGLDIRGEGGFIVYYGMTDTPIADAPNWITEEAIKVIKAEGDPISVAPEVANRIIEEAFNNVKEAPEGESNNVLNVESYRLGQLVASQAITREYAEHVLFEAAKLRGKPEYEAKATIKSGLDGGMVNPMTSPFTAPPEIIGKAEPDIWTPKYFTLEDLLDTTKLKKPQLFKDWSTEDIHITTADGGTGKTTLKLYEAVCLALGLPFLGFPCLQRGKTLFITGEDTAAKLGAALGQIAKEMNILNDPSKTETLLSSIVVKKDSDMTLIIKDRSGFIHPNYDAMNKIIEAVKVLQPKMIVFDPISSFWGSEAALNDMAKAIGKFMNRLVEESGACVEMINHMGKASSSSKDMSQFAGRGGTGLPSNARVSRVLRAVSDEEYVKLTGFPFEDKQSAILCNVNKFTDGSPLYNKEFLILRTGYLFERKNIDITKVQEEQKESDSDRVYSYVKEMRSAGKFITKKTVIGFFKSHADKMSKERVENAIDLLVHVGQDDKHLRVIDHPDATISEKTLIVTDESGREV